MKPHADLISTLAVSKDPRACRGLPLPGLFITGALLNERERQRRRKRERERERGREGCWGASGGSGEGMVGAAGVLYTGRDVWRKTDKSEEMCRGRGGWGGQRRRETLGGGGVGRGLGEV